MSEFFRFRSIDALLEKRRELEEQTIYFASPAFRSIGVSSYVTPIGLPNGKTSALIMIGVLSVHT